MALNLTGKILKILPQEQINKLTKQVFVVETTDKYPQKVAFELYNDKISLLQNVKENEDVTVDFNVRGREWNGKYFTSLAAWKISPTAVEVTTADHQTQRNIQTEDLPF